MKSLENILDGTRVKNYYIRTIKMKKYQILRVDNDLVQKVDLRLGENVISRNVITGNKNEHLIKQAAIINLSPENEMTITPISPCYMKSAETSRWELLKLGTTVPIKPGDICCLAQNKCCFKVIFILDKMDVNKECALKRKASNDKGDVTPDKKFYSGDGDNSQFLSNLGKNNNDMSKPIIGKGVLRESNILMRNKEDDLHDVKYKQTRNPKETNSADVMNENNQTAENITYINKKCSISKIAPSTEMNSNESFASKKNNKLVNTEDIQTATVNNTHSTTTKASLRKSCKYGEKCYRRSMEHKSKFSHVGDPDYINVDNGEECPYGRNCYRKNPDHRARYKHTGGTNVNAHGKQNAKRTAVNAPLGNFSEIEDSQEEDSFDESIDESEYEPSNDTDSTDDDEMYSDKEKSEYDNSDY